LAQPDVDAPTLKDAIEKVKNAAMKIGRAVYQNAGASGNSSEQQQGQENTNQNQGEGDQNDANKK
jgi:hypothetical protein